MVTPAPDVRAVVIAGPAGVGKTTVGLALAGELGWEFVDADALHSPASIDRMRRGVSLTDAERWPWLDRVRDAIADRLARDQRVVVACSALREEYRRYLASPSPLVRIVVLDAPRGVLKDRIEARAGHFAGASLVDAQLGRFERPEETIDATAPIGTVVSRIRAAIGHPVA